MRFFWIWCISLIGLLASCGGGAGGSSDANGNLPSTPPLTPPQNNSPVDYSNTPNSISTVAVIHHPVDGSKSIRLKGLVRDSVGNFYTSDIDNNQIYKISPAGKTTLFAGSGQSTPLVNGSALNATFNQPHGLTIDKDDNIYVADTGNHCIRKITPDGTVSTYGLNAATIRSPRAIVYGEDQRLYIINATFPLLSSIIPVSGGVAYGVLNFVGNYDFYDIKYHDKKLYLLNNNWFNAEIVSIDTFAKLQPPDYNYPIVHLAGGAFGVSDGDAKAAQFRFPVGIARRADGAWVVADVRPSMLRLFNEATMQVTTIVGKDNCNSSGVCISNNEVKDGLFADAVIDQPFSVFASHIDDSVYFLDGGGAEVRGEKLRKINFGK